MGTWVDAEGNSGVVGLSHICIMVRGEGCWVDSIGQWEPQKVAE